MHPLQILVLVCALAAPILIILRLREKSREDRESESALPIETWHPGLPFCTRCFEQTFNVSAGDTSRVNGIGRSLSGSSSPCPECRSVVQTLVFTYFFVPIVPFRRYRVVYVPKGIGRSYYSRKLRSQEA